MSLGYQKGKYWVSDERFRRYTEGPQYRELVAACAASGFYFECHYSYTSRLYTAECVTAEAKRGGGYTIVRHANAFDENPLAAIIAAVRQRPHPTFQIRVACAEGDAALIVEELRLLGPLAVEIGRLTDALRGPR